MWILRIHHLYSLEGGNRSGFITKALPLTPSGSRGGIENCGVELGSANICEGDADDRLVIHYGVGVQLGSVREVAITVVVVVVDREIGRLIIEAKFEALAVLSRKKLRLIWKA